MTVEQLKRANEICYEMDRLRHFRSKCVLSDIDLISDNKKLYMRSYPDLIELVRDYLSKKIIELENELEEL